LVNTSKSMKNSKKEFVTYDLKNRRNGEISFEVSLLCDKEFQDGDKTRIG
jgi:hypothetical protein